MEAGETTAYVATIQKDCIHDGPGIRTTVFLMACPLRCKWCQNPENLYSEPVLLYSPEKCNACGSCMEVCPNGCITRDPITGMMVFDRTNCDNCGLCADVCLTGARELCGREMTPQSLFDEVMKNEVFFRTTGGGITISGGEPTCHIEFLKETFAKFQAAGISTALETSGFCATKKIMELAPYVDNFLFDFKADTEAVHRQWTGVSNQIIKKNLNALIDAGNRVIVRIPLIPTVNDGDEFVKMMDYLASTEKVEEINILPFHQFGMMKYDLVDDDYEMKEMAECPPEISDACADIARSYGFKVDVGGANIVAK